MLNDTNRLGVFDPGGFAGNIVGSGSDGTTYWNVFNIEGESAISADIVTYGSLTDMLNDTNRLGVFDPGGRRTRRGSGAQHVGPVRVGSGSGRFEASQAPDTVLRGFRVASAHVPPYRERRRLATTVRHRSRIVTYATLADMLTDTNRTGNFTPDTFGGSAHNVVGTGAGVFLRPVPEPCSAWMAMLGISSLLLRRRRPGAHQS
jgi:hypothetical protein